jgi:hypothetical protein
METERTRAYEGPIQRLVELGHSLHPLERLTRIVDLEVFDLAWLETNLVGRFVTIRIVGRFVDLHLMEAWSKRPDVAEAFKVGPVLEARHFRRDKNAEVTDMRVGQVDDALPRAPPRPICA